jgi:uncharacterized membrane protein HdeD (DUF308 family)
MRDAARVDVVHRQVNLAKERTVIVTNPFSPGSWSRDQIDRISSGWWVLLITGLISVLAGGIILFNDWTVDDLALFVGLLLILRGIFMMFSVPLDGSARAWSIVLGLLEVAVGIAVFAWPGPTLLVVAFAIGWYILFSGIMTIAGSIAGRSVLPYWGLMLAFGIFETAFAFWLLARPGLTLVAAILAIGLWTMVYGVVQIALSFEVKNLSARADEAASDLDAATSPRRLERAAL